MDMRERKNWTMRRNIVTRARPSVINNEGLYSVRSFAPTNPYNRAYKAEINQEPYIYTIVFDSLTTGLTVVKTLDFDASTDFLLLGINGARMTAAGAAANMIATILVEETQSGNAWQNQPEIINNFANVSSTPARLRLLSEPMIIPRLSSLRMTLRVIRTQLANSMVTLSFHGLRIY